VSAGTVKAGALPVGETIAGEPGGSGAITAGGTPGTAGARTGDGGKGTLAQAASSSVPRMAANPGNRLMLVILLEALLALAVFVFIIWWTMFSGRKGGEPPRDEDDKPDQR
jgi:hypothetical protein